MLAASLARACLAALREKGGGREGGSSSRQQAAAAAAAAGERRAWCGLVNAAYCFRFFTFTPPVSVLAQASSDEKRPSRQVISETRHK